MTDTHQKLLSGILEPMRRVDELIRERLDGADASVREVLANAARYRGKRLRPVLLLQSARLFGQPSHQHVIAAAAVELFHTATLVHDDIVDGARLRRGGPSRC